MDTRGTATTSIRAAMDALLASLNSAHTQQSYATPLKHFGVFLAGRGMQVDQARTTSLTVDHAIEFVP